MFQLNSKFLVVFLSHLFIKKKKKVHLFPHLQLVLAQGCSVCCRPSSSFLTGAEMKD